MPDMFKVSINKTPKFKTYNCPRLTIAVIKYSGKSNIKNEYFICTRYTLSWQETMWGAETDQVAGSVKKQNVILCLLFRIPTQGRVPD